VNTVEPTNRTQDKRRTAWSLRTAVAAAVLVTAVPAGAAVIMQNFVKADITRAAACMTKVEGNDARTYATAANAPYFDVNETNVAATTDGVSLLNEAITVKAFKGDRMIASDVMRIRNTCNAPITVQLKNEAQPFTGATATSGDWTELSVKMYLGKSAVAATVFPAALTAGTSLTDFSVGAQWDATPVAVKWSGAGTTATVINATTGTMTIPANQEVQVGFAVDAGTTTATTDATFRVTVSGTF
jgi:hypothetical protein